MRTKPFYLLNIIGFVLIVLGLLLPAVGQRLNPLNVSTLAASGSQPDFTMSTISPVYAHLGRSALSTITVFSQNGFSGTVGFSYNTTANLAYPGMVFTVSFNPVTVQVNGVYPTSASTTVSFSSSIPGDYSVGVKAVSGPVIHSLQILFTQLSTPAPAIYPTFTRSSALLWYPPLVYYLQAALVLTGIVLVATPLLGRRRLRR